MHALPALTSLPQFPLTTLSFHFANSNVRHLWTLDLWHMATRFSVIVQCHGYAVLYFPTYCISPCFFFHPTPVDPCVPRCRTYRFPIMLFCHNPQETLGLCFKLLWHDGMWCVSDQKSCDRALAFIFICCLSHSIVNLELIKWRFCIKTDQSLRLKRSQV